MITEGRRGAQRGAEGRRGAQRGAAGLGLVGRVGALREMLERRETQKVQDGMSSKRKRWKTCTIFPKKCCHLYLVQHLVYCSAWSKEQNIGFGPKQNTNVTLEPPTTTHPPKTFKEFLGKLEA